MNKLKMPRGNEQTEKPRVNEELKVSRVNEQNESA